MIGDAPDPTRPASPGLFTGEGSAGSRVVTPPGDAPKILVIEDDDAVRMVLGRTLSHAGFAPVLGGTVAEAERLLSNEIAAMVLDFRLPGSRGDLFFYFASSKYPHLRRRTVFLTADASIEVEQLVSYTGCPLRHKPFVNTSLIEFLRSILDGPGTSPHD